MDTSVNRITGVSSGDAATSPSDGSRAAARLLEMAARDADEWRSEARSEAAAVVDGAKIEAAHLVQAARDEAQQFTATAQMEAEALLDGARNQATQLRAELEATKRRHNAEISELQQLEDGYRQRLRRDLTALLEQVDAPRSGEEI